MFTPTVRLVLLIFFSAITLPVCAALADADLDKIRSIVQEEIEPIKADIGTLKTEVATLKTDMAVVKTDIASLKTDVMSLKTDMAVVKTDIASLKTDVKNLKETFTDNFNRQNNIIIGCIGLPFGLLVIGATVWGILTHTRNRKDQTLEQQIETLKQEIETLKQQRIVRS